MKKISISYQDRISFKLSDHLVGRIREEKPLKIAIALFPENSMGKNNFCMRYLTKREGKKKNGKEEEMARSFSESSALLNLYF